MAFAPPLVKAQGAGTYGWVFEKCSLKHRQRPITKFRFRWIWDGVTDGTLLADNYDTGDRCLVGPLE